MIVATCNLGYLICHLFVSILDSKTVNDLIIVLNEAVNPSSVRHHHL
jgi:hypothetical protein